MFQFKGNSRVQTVLLSGLSMLLLHGCGGDEETNSALSLEVTPSAAFVIPAGVADSCTDLFIEDDDDGLGGSVAAPRVQFRKVQLQWTTQERELTVFDITLEVNNVNFSGGKLKLTLSGDEIDTLFQVNNGFVGLGPATKSSVQPAAEGGTTPTPEQIAEREAIRPSGVADCSLNYGGLSLAEEDPTFSATGTITIRGMSTDLNGDNPVPERARTTVSLRAGI